MFKMSWCVFQQLRRLSGRLDEVHFTFKFGFIPIEFLVREVVLNGLPKFVSLFIIGMCIQPVQKRTWWESTFTSITHSFFLTVVNFFNPPGDSRINLRHVSWFLTTSPTWGRFALFSPRTKKKKWESSRF